MGNGFAKLTPCFAGDRTALHGRRHVSAAATLEAPGDESVGHSFCYVRPDLPLARSGSSKVHHSEETTTFRSISGAAVSANTATPLSTALLLLPSELTFSSAASFESSTSFSSVPLQPVPRFSGPLSGPLAADHGFMSGPLASDRSFMSGPLAADRGFMSGPLADRAAGGIFSGPLDRPPSLSASSSSHLHRSLSQTLALHRCRRLRPRRTASSLLRGAAKAIARTISVASKFRAMSSPIKKSRESADSKAAETTNPSSGVSTTNPSSGIGGLTIHPSSSSDQMSMESSEESDSSEAPTRNLQWAQGKAGEDRVHVVVSEKHGWVFVGIYDGFNGPDATDYLLSNLYLTVHKELKGLLWEDKYDGCVPSDDSTGEFDLTVTTFQPGVDGCCNYKKGKRRWCSGAAEIWEENHRRWKGEWDRERLELDRKLKEQLSRSSSRGAVNHKEVLKALSQALRKTENAYLDIADKMVSENPELALMGSCVLVMLMKGEDVYLMNVGDSRAVLARKVEPDTRNSVGKVMQDLERMKEDMVHDLEAYDGGDQMDGLPGLAAMQLTLDHSTCIEEEVRRIKREHPDDPSAIVNDRVKGSLKVTRAFGAGFLKQPKWNNALLEMFRVDYIGTSPYISCSPHLFHHRLSPRDRFLILSSDGLYQYFTNEEAVAEVEMFIATTPEGDPAQHLVEEVLFRAARKAGMDFHELLEIPQGVRRQYHDDVSIIVVSLEGRIWRSWV